MAGSNSEETKLYVDQLTGIIAGRFVIRHRVGMGGMGEVYRAEDTKLKRTVALKRISPKLKEDPRYRARFLKEAERASSLSDPNIASIHDVIEVDDDIFLIMEYVEGVTLRSRLGEPYALSPFLELAIQCVQGLIAAHTVGIVHRDIKPENIMVTGSNRVKICDFGLARPIHDGNTVTSAGPLHLSGTPAYMAPEVLGGETSDQRVDIFSLGVVFYEMLTGKGPQDRRIPISRLNPVVPAKLELIVNRMLSKEADDRYSTASELLTALSDLSSTEIRSKRMSAGIVIVAVVAIILAAALAWNLLGGRGTTTALGERDYLLVGHMQNMTGESVFDQTLDDAMAVQLNQSPFLNIVSEQRIQDALRFMDKPADTPLTPGIALEICRRESLKAMLTGSLVKIGTQYVFSVNAVNCRTGDTLLTEQVQAGRREEVLASVGATASTLRHRLGESLASIQKFDEPIENATTPSLEAFRAFTLGNAERRRGRTEESLAFLKHAIELDPNFALAYARLSQTYYNLEERTLGGEYAKKAFDLRDRVSEREKFYIAITYYHTVTGETDKTLELYELWRQTYPRDVLAYTGLVWTHINMGIQLDKALELAKAACQIDPNHVPATGWLATAYRVNNDFSSARSVIEAAMSRGLEGATLHHSLYLIAFAQSDTATANAQAQWAANQKADEHRFLLQQAHAAAFSGKLNLARQLYSRGSESAERLRFHESAGIILAEEALTEAEMGSPQAVRRLVSEALKIARVRDALGVAAIALARADAKAEAQSLIEELAQSFPLDFRVKSIWIPAARAALALNQNNAAQAIEDLKAASRYELGSESFVAATYRPIYFRGLAYLQMKAGQEAALEFKKILDHRGILPVSPFYPLAQLGLARAYALMGDTKNSRASYNKFFEFWKNADADLSVFKQASMELKKLGPMQ